MHIIVDYTYSLVLRESICPNIIIIKKHETEFSSNFSFIVEKQKIDRCLLISVSFNNYNYYFMIIIVTVH